MVALEFSVGPMAQLIGDLPNAHIPSFWDSEIWGGSEQLCQTGIRVTVILKGSDKEMKKNT